MRKITRALTGLAAAALAVGMAGPALAATQARPPERVPARAAFQPGSGQSVIDWNRELITLLGTPGLQPATIHPTRSFAILQAAEYDAVVSITHVGQPYLFTVPAPRDARPDAAADQAAHDVLTSLYPAAKSSLDHLLATELSAIPNSQRKRDGIGVGTTIAQLLIGLRAADGSAATPPPFTAGTQPGSGVTRSFASLQAAADEAGLSRIFAGQHTLLDHQAGQALGRQVGEFTVRDLQSGHAHSG